VSLILCFFNVKKKRVYFFVGEKGKVTDLQKHLAPPNITNSFGFKKFE
jgi:hypothetical protein